MKLRALEPEDLELLYTIENDSSLWTVSNTTVPYSYYDLRNYITTQQNDIYADKQLRLVIQADRAIGLIDLFNFDPRNMRAEMGVAILKEEQGNGHAQEAIRLMAEYARTSLLLHQIYCIVPADNEPSLKMLRSVGFTDEQTLKQWIRTNDGWLDAIHFQLFL